MNPTDRRRRRAMAAVLGGTFLVLLDMTIVNVALPSIAEDLDAVDGIEWVVTAHLLALGVTQAPTSWLADRLGLRPVFLGAIAGFAAWAVVAATAPGLGVLIAARVGQGLCGGGVVAVGTLLMYEMAPAESRGRTVGYAGALALLAPALGPVLSGWVVGSTSWRWLLFGFAPVGAAVVVGALKALPGVHPGRPRALDWTGSLMLTGALVGILTACSRAEDWGPTSPRFLVLIGGSVALGLLFVLRSARVEHPLIDLALYRSRDFSISMAIVASIAMAQFARNVFIPLEMQAVRGLSPLGAGAVLTPGALLGAMAMPTAGRMADRVGPKPLIVTGLVLTAIATGLLAGLDRTTSVVLVGAYIAISSVGTVMVAMPITLLSLDAIPRRLRTQGSAVRSLTRHVSGAVGTAVLAAVIAADVGRLTSFGESRDRLRSAQDAYNRGFLVSAALLAVGLGLAVRLSNRRVQGEAAELPG